MTRRRAVALALVVVVLAGGARAEASTTWSSTPIGCGTYPVFLGDPPFPRGALARMALRKLAAASGLRLPITSNPAAAKVLVDWRPSSSDDGGGHVVSQYGHRPIVYLHPAVPDQTLGLTLHEFGHVVGLGHSSGTVDVMSPDGWPHASDYSADEVAALATICGRVVQ